MLTITIPEAEHFDEEKNEFLYFEAVTLELEHSLAVLSKWEQIYEKPFLSAEKKSSEEVLGYVKCMIQTPNFPPEVLPRLTQENLEAINAYIDAKMTATWFNDQPGARRNSETITAELIYYWMCAFQIPLEFENRHLNHLFTLIRVCNAKNQPEKKMGMQEHAGWQRDLNAERRALMGTAG